MLIVINDDDDEQKARTIVSLEERKVFVFVFNLHPIVCPAPFFLFSFFLTNFVVGPLNYRGAMTVLSLIVDDRLSLLSSTMRIGILAKLKIFLSHRSS